MTGYAVMRQETWHESRICPSSPYLEEVSRAEAVQRGLNPCSNCTGGTFKP